MAVQPDIIEEREMVTATRPLPILEIIARSWMSAAQFAPTKLYIFIVWAVLSIPVIVATAFLDYWRIDGLLNSCYILLSAGLYCTLFCRRALGHQRGAFSTMSAARSSIDTGFWVLALALIGFLVAVFMATAPHARDYGWLASLFEAASMMPWFGDLFMNVFTNPEAGLPAHNAVISGYFPGLGTPLIVAEPQIISNAITDIDFYSSFPQWGDIIWLFLTILVTLIIILPLSLTLPAAALGHEWVNGFVSLGLCRQNILKMLVAYIFTGLIAAFIAAMLLYAFAHFVILGFFIDSLAMNPEGLFIFTVGFLSLILAYLFFWHVTCAFLAETYHFLIRGKRIPVG